MLTRPLSIAAALVLASSACAAPVRMHGHPLPYPASVLAADAAHGDTRLHAVWDLHNLNGSRIAKSSLTNWSVYSYPAGVAKVTTSLSEEHALVQATSGTNTLSGIDLTDASLTIVGNGTTLSVSDFYLRDSGGNHLINLGISEGGLANCTPGALTMSYGTVDINGVSNGNSTPIFAGCSGDVLAFDHVKFQNANGGYLITGLTTQTVTNSVFGGFGQNPNSSNPGEPAGPYGSECIVGNKAHLEAVKANGGTFTYQDVLFDPSDKPLPDGCKSGLTAIVFLDASAAPNSPITATLDHVVITGAAHLSSNTAVQNLFYTVQLKCVITTLAGTNYDPANVSLTIINSVIQKASVGYSTRVNQGRVVVTGASGDFTVNERVTDGTTTAVVTRWTPATGELQLNPNGGPTAGDPTASWGGSGTFSGTITGNTSHTTATVSTAKLGVCNITDGGGNYDFDSGLAHVFSNSGQ